MTEKWIGNLLGARDLFVFMKNGASRGAPNKPFIQMMTILEKNNNNNTP